MLASILPITALGELNCFVHGNEGSQPQSPTIPTRLLVCLGHRSINLRSQDCVVIDQLFQQRENILHIWQICEERLNPTVFSRNSSTQRVGGMLEIRLVTDDGRRRRAVVTDIPTAARLVALQDARS